MVDGAGAGTEDADRLIANLPAVAVRAVEEVPAPALARTGDIGKLVARAGRDEDPPRGQHPAAGELDGEAVVDPEHSVRDDLDAVAGPLRAPARAGPPAASRRGTGIPACVRRERFAAPRNR